MKRCPFCAEEIQDAAILCRYCGRDLPPAPEAPPAILPPPEPPAAAAPELEPAFSYEPKILRTSPNTPAIVVGCIAIAFVLLYLFVVAADNRGMGKIEPPKPPPTAAEAYAHFEELRTSGSGEEALAAARALVARYPGTSEAGRAGAEIEGLDKALQLAKAEQRKRDAEAKAADEVRALKEKWSYSKVSDSMSSKSGIDAGIHSDNLVRFDFPYQGAQDATLDLREHPRYGKDVIFSIQKGQLMCHSFSSCNLIIRFDEGEAERWTGKEPADHDTTTIFIDNYSRFLQKLRKAKKVRIQVEVYHQGAPTFEFSVGGFDEKRYRAGW